MNLIAHVEEDNMVNAILALENIREEIVTVRDEQEAIPCTDDKDDICGDFDRITDSVDVLINKFKVNDE